MGHKPLSPARHGLRGPYCFVHQLPNLFGWILVPPGAVRRSRRRCYARMNDMKPTAPVWQSRQSHRPWRDLRRRSSPSVASDGDAARRAMTSRLCRETKASHPCRETREMLRDLRRTVGAVPCKTPENGPGLGLLVRRMGPAPEVRNRQNPRVLKKSSLVYLCYSM
jgi:hypothetical protein